MARVRVSVVIDAPPAAVWAAIDDIERHVDWMEDAVAIRFTSPRRRGVGTTFECDTHVGPLRLTDQMAITEWEPGETMGVRHIGLVTGSGHMTLRCRRANRTTFGWDEHLEFPWWLGGSIGGIVGARILRRVWRRSLQNLKVLVETQAY